MRKLMLAAAALPLLLCCAKPMIRASTTQMEPVSRTFAADPNRTYYAIRHALATRGYPVAIENLAAGTITTSWVATKADSHYIEPFRTRDYGAVPAYHQLEIRVSPEGGGLTRVEITSGLKSIVAFAKSSSREETAVLDEVANYLHSGDLGVTNVGVEE